MSKINQIVGDILKKVNPDYANRLVIARHITRELGDKKLIICSSGIEAEALDKQLIKMNGKGCEYFAELNESQELLNGKPVKSLENIMYEDTDNTYIAVIAENV